MVVAWLVTTCGIRHYVIAGKRLAAFLRYGSVGLAEIYQSQFSDHSRG
jgi:hypothetical protein